MNNADNNTPKTVYGPEAAYQIWSGFCNRGLTPEEEYALENLHSDPTAKTWETWLELFDNYSTC